MKSFAEYLADLPGAEGIQALRLAAPDGRVELIENRPGSQGSVRVYAHLAASTGAIDPTSAEAGLTLYAEHAIDAAANPGKHPNIDRLYEIVSTGETWQVEVMTQVPAEVPTEAGSTPA